MQCTVTSAGEQRGQRQALVPKTARHLTESRLPSTRPMKRNPTRYLQPGYLLGEVARQN